MESSSQKPKHSQLSKTNILDLSKDIYGEILLKLDGKSAKSFCLTTKKFSNMCQRSQIWKRLVQRDFPDSYKEMIYIDEPIWTKVYFWFERKEELKNKLNFGLGIVNQSYGTAIFYDDDIGQGSSSFVSLIGCLLKLGAAYNGSFELTGLYMNKFSFTIHNSIESFVMMVSTTLSIGNKIYDNMMNDIKEYIFMIEPMVYTKPNLKWDLLNIIFSERIPNTYFNSPYSYLYRPEFTISKVEETEEMEQDYFEDIFLNAEHKIFPTSMPIDEFFELVTPGEINLTDDIGTYVCGVYYGTPFLIFTKPQEDQLYLASYAKNIDLLIDKLVTIIEEEMSK